MNTTATAIVRLLNNYSAITATVDSDGSTKRIYNKFTKAGGQGKFIVINESPGTSPVYGIFGDAGWSRSTWQVDCYADTDLEAWAIREAIRKAFEALGYVTIGGVDFYQITFNTLSAESDQLNLGSALDQHRSSLEMTIKSAHPTT